MDFGYDKYTKTSKHKNTDTQMKYQHYYLIPGRITLCKFRLIGKDGVNSEY